MQVYYLFSLLFIEVYNYILRQNMSKYKNDLFAENPTWTCII